MVSWCLLVNEKYLKLILAKKKTWEIRTKPIFAVGERIALGNTKTKLIEGYATVVDVKKKTPNEMKRYNDKHFADDFIDKHWSDRPWLYALVLAEVECKPMKQAYPSSHGNPKVRLNESVFS